MANSYTQFILMIPKLTTKEKAWFERELRTPEPEEWAQLDDETQQNWLKVRGIDEPDYWPDFSHRLSKEKSRWLLEVFSEESANLENVCFVMQRYLQTFHPDKHIGFEWAFTCSALRLGEFGGGAAFITATKIDYLNTGSWLREQEKRKEVRT